MSKRNNRGNKRNPIRVPSHSQSPIDGSIVGLPGSIVNPGILAAQISYSGPIPPPSFLREYNEIVFGSAERILALAELQTHHRIDLEKTALGASIRRSNWGLVAGFILGMTAICFGGTAMLLGHNVTGFLFGVSGLGSLTGIFVVGKYMTLKERRDKDATMKRLPPSRT